jgi:hypothetical protein
MPDDDAGVIAPPTKAKTRPIKAILVTIFDIDIFASAHAPRRDAQPSRIGSHAVNRLVRVNSSLTTLP